MSLFLFSTVTCAWEVTPEKMSKVCQFVSERAFLQNLHLKQFLQKRFCLFQALFIQQTHVNFVLVC